MSSIVRQIEPISFNVGVILSCEGSLMSSKTHKKFFTPEQETLLYLFSPSAKYPPEELGIETLRQMIDDVDKKNPIRGKKLQKYSQFIIKLKSECRTHEVSLPSPKDSNPVQVIATIAKHILDTFNDILRNVPPSDRLRNKEVGRKMLEKREQETEKTIKAWRTGNVQLSRIVHFVDRKSGERRQKRETFPSHLRTVSELDRRLNAIIAPMKQNSRFAEDFKEEALRMETIEEEEKDSPSEPLPFCAAAPRRSTPQFSAAASELAPRKTAPQSSFRLVTPPPPIPPRPAPFLGAMAFKSTAQSCAATTISKSAAQGTKPQLAPRPRLNGSATAKSSEKENNRPNGNARHKPVPTQKTTSSLPARPRPNGTATTNKSSEKENNRLNGNANKPSFRAVPTQQPRRKAEPANTPSQPAPEKTSSGIFSSVLNLFREDPKKAPSEETKPQQAHAAAANSRPPKPQGKARPAARAPAKKATAQQPTKTQPSRAAPSYNPPGTRSTAQGSAKKAATQPAASESSSLFGRLFGRSDTSKAPAPAAASKPAAPPRAKGSQVAARLAAFELLKGKVVSDN